jgi:hypothetical protein
MSLRSVFGQSRNEVWAELARAIGADHKPGGFWGGGKVTAQVRDWTVTLDTYTVSTGHTSSSYTRLRAPYVNARGFRFTIYRRGPFSDIGKWLGGQDVEVGDPEFDRAFIVKATDEFTVRNLLSKPRLRELISAQKTIRFEVKDDEGWFGATFPEGVDELRVTVNGVVKDVERLKLLFDLFAETLQLLCDVGAAYDHDPRVTL